MTQIKNFGLGIVAVALFAAMALATVSTASANVADVVDSPSAVDPSGTSSITIVSDTFEVQQISAGSATAGTFTLTYSGQTTSAIAFNATAATIEAALEALSNVTDVAATGGPVGNGGAAVLVEFRNPSGNVAQMTIDGAGLTGAAPVITTTIQGQGTGGDLTLLASSGVWDVSTALCGVAACTGMPGTDSASITIPEAGNDLRTVVIDWIAGTAAGTATLTAIQNGDAEQETVIVRGGASSVEAAVLEAAPAGTATSCGTNVASSIESTTATNGYGLDTGVVCALVKDAQGNAIPGAVVIFTTTAGTLSASSATTNSNGIATVNITHGTTGTSGTTATVTASQGTASGTATVIFGGNPASCTVVLDPATVQVGTQGTAKVTVLDSTGAIVPDNMRANLQAVHSGTGQNVALLGDPATIENGEASASVVTGIVGNIAVVAEIEQDDGTALTTAVNCTGTLAVQSGPVAPTPGTGDGTLTAPTFGTGNVGSAVFAGGTIEELSAAVTASGGTAVWVQGTDGNWYRYNTLATGATAFVNNAFNAQFSAGLSQSAVFVVK